MAIADFPYSFASQPIIDPTTGQPVLNATGGVLLDPRTSTALSMADMNGNPIDQITGNAYGMSQQFRSTQLAVLVKFGSVFVQAPAIELFDLVQTSADAVTLAQSAQALAQAAAAAAQAAAAAAGSGGGGGAVSSVAGRTGAVTLAKADVGLANVDNTSDAAKPVSTAVATALALKAGLVGGLLPLDLVPAGYIHSVSYAAAIAAVSRAAFTTRADIRIRIEGGLNTDPLPTWMLDWDYQDAVPA